MSFLLRGAAAGAAAVTQLYRRRYGRNMPITLVGSSRELKHKRFSPNTDLLDLVAGGVTSGATVVAPGRPESGAREVSAPLRYGTAEPYLSNAAQQCSTAVKLGIRKARTEPIINRSGRCVRVTRGDLFPGIT